MAFGLLSSDSLAADVCPSCPKHTHAIEGTGDGSRIPLHTPFRALISASAVHPEELAAWPEQLLLLGRMTSLQGLWSGENSYVQENVGSRELAVCNSVPSRDLVREMGISQQHLCPHSQ